MIKLFIFDLDGVLTSTSDEHLSAWKQLGNEINIIVDKSIEEKTKGVSRLDSLNIILKDAGVLNRYSKSELIDLSERKNNLYKELIANYSEKDLYKGVIELFKYLKSKNILIALGSASKNGPDLLKSLGITSYFDYIVDPSFLNSKPSPDIFLNARDFFNLESSECVGVEDAIAGVKSINSAGIFSIGIGSSDILTEANVVYLDIEHIDYKVLEKIIGDKL